jgi:hypothetical protein
MTRGKTGKSGPREATGARERRGAGGASGPLVRRAEILAIVDDQFVEVRKNFKTQLKYATKIQTQLNEIHSVLKNLIEQSSYTR